MPASLTYIVLSTRGCSPRTPAAVMSMNGCENQSFPQNFKGLQECTRHYKKCGALPTIKPYLLAIRFHGLRSLTRKENSSQGSCWRLRVQLRYRKSGPKGPEYPCFGSGILTHFPFDKWPMIGYFETEFPYLLGSTNPCPTAVHMEHFSNSVFKVLIWIFATTTMICTRGHFTQAHAKGFTTTPTPSYSSELHYLLWRLSIVTTLERHSFLGLFDSAGVLLHTP